MQVQIQRSRRGHSGILVTSRLWGLRVPGSKPDSTEDPPCMWACCTPNHTWGTKRPPAGVMRKFGEGMLAQVSSSSSDLKITNFIPKYPSCYFKMGR
ncbi:hypothetical protein AVEN_209566-1 [Araneus ventricosus]|uniref:Uncharacterized protein n=1 Tax=Araneus ventricosus TaxID=182803 RepID=A0A4Y2EKR3_ARAVE|nr:hypothetical protein AVEN_7699-1 [Araneus ventricosus]GBM29137.1 hypothetical protein AVEN_66205-1 [Araneus ventricosus]GBM29158.1 hypothetical protein AVEN_85285-1 [Araneus ventricosus]GBM29227.1 hypothetical protein AVEN_209566-1 [Araneus ventricosus]